LENDSRASLMRRSDMDELYETYASVTDRTSYSGGSPVTAVRVRWS
jgi:hypothetical protein